MSTSQLFQHIFNDPRIRERIYSFADSTTWLAHRYTEQACAELSKRRPDIGVYDYSRYLKLLHHYYLRVRSRFDTTKPYISIWTEPRKEYTQRLEAVYRSRYNTPSQHLRDERRRQLHIHYATVLSLERQASFEERETHRRRRRRPNINQQNFDNGNSNTT